MSNWSSSTFLSASFLKDSSGDKDNEFESWYIQTFYFTFPLTSFAIWCVLNKTKAVLLFPGFFIGTWGNSSKILGELPV